MSDCVAFGSEGLWRIMARNGCLVLYLRGVARLSGKDTPANLALFSDIGRLFTIAGF